MAQLALARFRGDTGFAWVSRTASTFYGGIVGLVIWFEFAPERVLSAEITYQVHCFREWRRQSIWTRSNSRSRFPPDYIRPPLLSRLAIDDHHLLCDGHPSKLNTCTS